MRSVFVGFETLNPENLRRHAKRQNLGRDYDEAIRRCHDLGVMVPSIGASRTAWRPRPSTS
jgi:hypothetical protein